MSTASLLFAQPPAIKSHVAKLMRQRGLSMYGKNWGEADLNRQLARAAQRDGNPNVTVSEATRAVENFAARSSGERLPGPDKNLSFVVEDSLRMKSRCGGEPHDLWQSTLAFDAKHSGVQFKLELVPGTVKTPSAVAKFFGKTETASYRVTATGDKVHVERFFDLYHQQRVKEEFGGE